MQKIRNRLFSTIVFLSLPAFIFAHGRYLGGQMTGWGMFPGFGLVIPLAVLGVIVFLIVRLTGKPNSGTVYDEALADAAKRFANGEITQDEFENIKKHLK